MNELELKLCDIQGRLFELSADKKYSSAHFVKLFMNSEIAKALDSKYNRMQWAGEEYLIDETMKRNYMIFHTMAPEVAIEDLKEIYRQK